MDIEKLPGEGETQIICRTRVRKECENCGEPATYRNTYLNDGATGARRNPASSAYGRDNCSWCSDHDQFLCGDCHQNRHNIGVPDGFRWCSTFECVPRFAHMFLEWDEKQIEQETA